MGDRLDEKIGRSRAAVAARLFNRAYHNSTLRSIVDQLKSVASVTTIPISQIRQSRTKEKARTWVMASLLYRWMSADPQQRTVTVGGSLNVQPVRELAKFGRSGMQSKFSDSSVIRFIEAWQSQFRNSPVETIGWILSTAVVTNLLVVLVTRSLTPIGIAIRILLLGVGIVAISLAPSRSWLYQSWLFSRLKAITDRFNLR